MKIVHVISTIDPSRGGPQGVVMRLAAAQTVLGHDVHIVCYSGPQTQKLAFGTATNIPHFLKINWHFLVEPNRMERVLSLAGRRLLRGVLSDAGFVHIHGVWETILLAASQISRKIGVPYCVRPAGMLDIWSMQQKRWKKQLALLLGYRTMLNEAKFIHALNADEARLLEPLRLRAPSIIIPNGVFEEEFTKLPTPGQFREAIALPEGKRFILYLSRLHAKKGLDILADSYARIAPAHPDVDLVVVGPDGGARESFVSQIGQLALADRVHLIGPIYGEDKLRALVDASCFCLPSRQEGFSVAITEALACGLPAVISDACHFPEVGTANAGIVVSLNPAAVASALAFVLDNPAMASTMGRNGQRLVRENYTWPRIAELTIRGYSPTEAVTINTKLSSSALVPAADH